MSHDCHQGSCHTHAHSHQHGGCNCCCHNPGGCGCSCHKGNKFSDQLLKIADEAWIEVVKEKIKDEIRKNGSDHVNELAKLLADSNRKLWKEKMIEKRYAATFEEELHSLLMCDKEGKHKH